MFFKQSITDILETIPMTLHAIQFNTFPHIPICIHILNIIFFKQSITDILVTVPMTLDAIQFNAFPHIPICMHILHCFFIGTVCSFLWLWYFPLLLNVFLLLNYHFIIIRDVTIKKILIAVIIIFIPSSIPANVFVIYTDYKSVFYSSWILTSEWVQFQLNPFSLSYTNLHAYFNLLLSIGTLCFFCSPCYFLLLQNVFLLLNYHFNTIHMSQTIKIEIAIDFLLPSWTVGEKYCKLNFNKYFFYLYSSLDITNQK